MNPHQQTVGIAKEGRPMDKLSVRIMLVMFAVCMFGFAVLCLVAFNRPCSAIVMFAIASSIVGYVNGWR
jgi:ABC-type microcin C transport system permease subunit YejB